MKDGGKQVFQALGDKNNSAALNAFRKAPRSKASRTALVEALHLSAEKDEGKLLLKMSDDDILTLSGGLQKFSEDDMQIALRFFRAKTDIAKEIGKIPPKDTPPAAPGA